jgi:amino acid transporter
LVIGVESTAPGYSLAATIGFIALIGGLGPHTPAVIIVSFVPMFCIATAYKYLNKADPDCGTTFSLMSRAMGAGWGWVGGWAVLFADIVVNANQAQIAGSSSTPTRPTTRARRCSGSACPTGSGSSVSAAASC